MMPMSNVPPCELANAATVLQTTPSSFLLNALLVEVPPERRLELELVPLTVGDALCERYRAALFLCFGDRRQECVQMCRPRDFRRVARERS